jgi:hypothetical protein
LVSRVGSTPTISTRSRSALSACRHACMCITTHGETVGSEASASGSRRGPGSACAPNSRQVLLPSCRPLAHRLAASPSCTSQCVLTTVLGCTTHMECCAKFNWIPACSMTRWQAEGGLWSVGAQQFQGAQHLPVHLTRYSLHTLRPFLTRRTSSSCSTSNTGASPSTCTGLGSG